MTRLGTLNVQGSKDPDNFAYILSTEELDVLCITETWESRSRLFGTTPHRISLAGPKVRNSHRHAGGVHLLSRSGSTLRYRSHLWLDYAQVIVARLPCGLTVIGAYVSPLRGRRALEVVLDWIKPWMRGPTVVLGDLNSRNVRWDTSRNTYGTALLDWATRTRANIYAPSEATCVNEHGASTVDLFLSRGRHLDDVKVSSGIWDYSTDHRLVTANVCQPSDGSGMLCNIPVFALQDPTLRRRATAYYKETLPGIAVAASAAQTERELIGCADAWHNVMLKPWRQFYQKTTNRSRRGWTRDLEQLAKERTKLVRLSERGNEAARDAARLLDKEIKRKHRARLRHIDRRLATQASRTGEQKPTSLDELVKRATMTSSPVSGPTPAVFLTHLRSVFRSDEGLSPQRFTVSGEFADAVERAVRSISPDKTAGPDGIAPRLLHLAPRLVARCLIALWVGVGRLGVLPPSFSAGRVTAVYKKGDVRQPGNYRPITVLNVCRRVLSAAIDDCIRSEIVLHRRQWGFRKKTSTEHAIAHIEKRLREGGRFTAMLDLRSAYDLAPRARIRDLCKARLPTQLSSMIETILSPTTIHVTGAPSQHLTVSSGVPQGDPASPSLFNIFIDVLLYELDTKLGPEVEAGSCYADDVHLSCHSRTQLQHALNVSTSWALNNRMEWNVSKSCSIVDACSSEGPHLQLSNEALPSKNQATYLGVEITREGVSANATKRRIEKAHRRLALIMAADSLQQLSFNGRRYIAKTHVMSLVDYAVHLSPMPTSLIPASAQLDRRVCQYVINAKVQPHATYRARALARLPSLGTRRKILAFRRLSSARAVLTSQPTDSLEYHKAYTLYTSTTLTDAGNDLPAEGMCIQQAQSEILLNEWRKADHGQRPIHASIRPIVIIRNIPAHLLHVTSRFFMNSIPAMAFRTLQETGRTELKTLMLLRNLSPEQLSKIKEHLEIIKSEL